MRMTSAERAAVVVLAIACASFDAQAQSIASRISSTRNGKVRMSFAARPDICGYNNGISTGRDRNLNQSRNWHPERSDDVEYDVECSEGPARVVITLSDGHIQGIKSYVGGRWRTGTQTVDLGTVSVRDATQYFLGVANNATGKIAGQAIFPTTLADSVEIAQPLFAIARNESRPSEVRDQAIFWLSQVGDERAVSMLETILRDSRDENIRDKAIFGLSQHRSRRGYAVLRQYAERESEPEELRGKAIFWLGQRRSDTGGEYLRSLYSRVRSENLKDKIIFSISQQKAPGNDEWLIDLASNSSESIEVRKKALFWAGQGGASMDKLAGLYSRMREREMKDHMIFMFSQRRERAAVDKLMEIARTDPDREARRKALFWLGQSRDPRVIAMISDMINR